MSTFNPLIPQPADDLDVSQGDLLGNFQALDAVFLQNHYTFSDGTINKGKHRVIETPFIAASPIPATTVDPIIYGHQYTAPMGIMQYSKGPFVGPAETIPTPLTSLQSPAAPIVLAGGASSNVMDFTGLNSCMAMAYGADLVLPSITAVYLIIWNGSSFTISLINSQGLAFTSSANILRITNGSGVIVRNNIIWTLDFLRVT